MKDSNKKLQTQLQKIKKQLPEETGSEFGRGFVYCLLLFSQHFSNSQMKELKTLKFLLDKNTEEREKIINKVDDKHNYGLGMDQAIFYLQKILPLYKSEEEFLSSQIQLWLNGASDHLYELVVPEQFKGMEIETLTNELREKGLDAGHGSGLMSRNVTYDELIQIQTLTGKIIKLIDKALGIEVIPARFGEL